MEDWEINPVLLARKFEEQFGKSPAEYQSPSKIDTLDNAIRKADEIRQSKFGISSGEKNDVEGVVFTDPDRTNQYVTIAWAGNKLHVIRVDSLSHKSLTFKNMRSVEAFLSKHVI